MRELSAELEGRQSGLSVMMIPPRITVVIPAFRRHHCLLGAIQSVLDSDVDRSAYEIILVTDSLSPELEGRLTELGVHILISDSPFVGETLACGVARARGEIISFLDDDDWFHSQKLRTVLEAFADPTILYFHHGFRRVHSDRTPISARVEVAPLHVRVPIPLSRSIAGWIRRKGGFLNCSSISVRRSGLLPHLSTLKRVSNAQDFTMLLLLSGPGYALFDGSKVLSDYRTHLSQGTHVFDGESLSPEHEQFLVGTVRSFQTLQDFAPTAAARRFARCRTDSYDVLTWTLTGRVTATDPRIRYRAIRAILGNLREGDLLSVLVLSSLLFLSRLSRRWTLRYYMNLKRTEQVGLGFRTEVPPASVPIPA